MEIIAGMDVSGDTLAGNYKYLGVVIGTSQGIEQIEKQIERPLKLHITRHSKDEQDSIIEKLHFDGKTCLAFCIKLDRSKILQNIQTLKIRKKRIPKGNLLRLFNRLLIQQLKPLIQEFLLYHKISIGELKIQCDSDSIPFLKSGGLKHSEVLGTPYILSDIVAWCNNKNRDPSGVSVRDFTSDIQNKMMKNLS